MAVLKELAFIKKLYESGENIVQYLKKINNDGFNSPETILISYDFQAGSYIKNYEKNKAFIDKYCSAIANTIEKYYGSTNSILEVGVGEATTMGNVIKFLKHKPDMAYGFDISWSRIKYAKSFLRSLNITNSTLFTGDLFNIPLSDNSIDIVYTSHSIEPNGGREKEAISEIFRVAREYVILLEPCFELANEEAQKRIVSHGYITQMQKAIKELGYDIVEFRLFDLCANPLNPTGLTVIKKSTASTKVENPFACPVTHKELFKVRNNYYSPESFLVFPMIDEIPCLLPGNAIVATHFEDLL